jgi:AcrR family transcriptional regulator
VPRAGLSNDVVVDEAARLLDEHGQEGLSLAALAERLGVRIPSLYKHVDGMPGIQRDLTVAAKTNFSTAMGQAAIGKSREDAIAAIATVYRHWALEHPGQYPLTMRAAVAGDAPDEEISAAFVKIIFDVLAGYDLRGDDAVDATRFLRAALHGFVALETGGGFAMPVNLNHSFQRLVDSVITALASWPRTT